MSILVVAWHLSLLAFAGLIFSAAISDILRFRIPNRISIAIVLLYPAYLLSASHPIEWLLAIGVAQPG